MPALVRAVNAFDASSHRNPAAPDLGRRVEDDELPGQVLFVDVARVLGLLVEGPALHLIQLVAGSVLVWIDSHLILLPIARVAVLLVHVLRNALPGLLVRTSPHLIQPFLGCPSVLPLLRLAAVVHVVLAALGAQSDVAATSPSQIMRARPCSRHTGEAAV